STLKLARVVPYVKGNVRPILFPGKRKKCMLSMMPPAFGADFVSTVARRTLFWLVPSLSFSHNDLIKNYYFFPNKGNEPGEEKWQKWR
ncbi:MAG TPA: hypothetical protein VLH18_05705, partial [Candidatus Limnocylindrales bacterium]|nr:hypothetical protein [Candidatus Limnocylindrales bacterium]